MLLMKIPTMARTALSNTTHRLNAVLWNAIVINVYSTHNLSRWHMLIATRKIGYLLICESVAKFLLPALQACGNLCKLKAPGYGGF